MVFDKPCTADQTFPWPEERITGPLVASVYLESATQEIADDGPYVVDLTTRFVDPSLTQVTAPRDKVRFELSLDDIGVVQPPYAAAGYTMTCSRDGGAFAACFTAGTTRTCRRSPGRTPSTSARRLRRSDDHAADQWDGGGALPAITPT